MKNRELWNDWNIPKQVVGEITKSQNVWSGDCCLWGQFCSSSSVGNQLNNNNKGVCIDYCWFGEKVAYWVLSACGAHYQPQHIWPRREPLLPRAPPTMSFGSNDFRGGCPYERLYSSRQTHKLDFENELKCNQITNSAVYFLVGILKFEQNAIVHKTDFNQYGLWLFLLIRLFFFKWCTGYYCTPAVTKDGIVERRFVSDTLGI